MAEMKREEKIRQNILAALGKGEYAVNTYDCISLRTPDPQVTTVTWIPRWERRGVPEELSSFLETPSPTGRVIHDPWAVGLEISGEEWVLIMEQLQEPNAEEDEMMRSHLSYCEGDWDFVDVPWYRKDIQIRFLPQYGEELVQFLAPYVWRRSSH